MEAKRKKVFITVLAAAAARQSLQRRWASGSTRGAAVRHLLTWSRCPV